MGDTHPSICTAAAGIPSPLVGSQVMSNAARRIHAEHSAEASCAHACTHACVCRGRGGRHIAVESAKRLLPLGVRRRGDESSKKATTPLFFLRGEVTFYEDLHLCNENAVRRR